ncbi:MAG: hypothetical protein ACI82A_002499 [Candidatus Azotimanducaceae bacterium]|jgi:hypothetical protein
MTGITMDKVMETVTVAITGTSIETIPGTIQEITETLDGMIGVEINIEITRLEH